MRASADQPDRLEHARTGSGRRHSSGLQPLWASIAASSVAATELRSEPPEAGTNAYPAAYLAVLQVPAMKPRRRARAWSSAAVPGEPLARVAVCLCHNFHLFAHP
jgi:hypothetical protein